MIDLGIAFVMGVLAHIIYKEIRRKIFERNHEDVYMLFNGTLYQNQITKDVITEYDENMVYDKEKDAYKLKEKQSKYTYYYDKIDEGRG